MAMRENQGLQIALILFVMITVVLAVTTFIYFNSSSEAHKEADNWRDKAQQAENAEKDLFEENKQLRNMLGYALKVEGGPELPQIEDNFEADMALFGATYNKEKNYRTLPKYFVGEVVKLNKSLVQASEDKATLVAQLDAARQQEQKNTAQFRTQHQNASDELAKMTVDYKSRREEVVTKMEDIQSRLDETSKQVASIRTAKEKEIDALQQRVAKLDLLRRTLTEKVDAAENKGTGNERPDGMVTWVSQRGGNVYINLGSADELQRSTMFTVYEAGTVSIGKSEPKASIEVTTIRGPHLAEARIVEDSLSNPILSNDMIYSPVWSPGQKTHFALVGFMDIDGDGNSDRGLIRSLIQQNGGTIDAEVLDDGKREGKLTIDTRYLVQGERATDKSKAEALRSYSDMLKQASDLGIETISVERLLSDMGWRGRERTVRLGKGGGTEGGNFEAVPKETTSTLEGDGFQRRTRPGSNSRRGSGY